MGFIEGNMLAEQAMLFYTCPDRTQIPKCATELKLIEDSSVAPAWLPNLGNHMNLPPINTVNKSTVSHFSATPKISL